MRKWLVSSIVSLGVITSLASASTIPPVPGNDGCYLNWDASADGVTGWSWSGTGGSHALESPDGTTTTLRVIDNSDTVMYAGNLNYDTVVSGDASYVVTVKYWANALTWNGVIVQERNVNWGMAGAYLWESNPAFRWENNWTYELRDENGDIYRPSTGQWYTITIRRNNMTEFDVWVDDGIKVSYLGTQMSSLSSCTPCFLRVGGVQAASHTFDSAYAFIKVGEAVVPEPSSIVLLGMVLLGFIRRKNVSC